MATIGAKAIRRAEAVARLERVAAVLGERHDVAVPVAPHFKDPDLKQTAELEAIAVFLESLDAATGGDRKDADTASTASMTYTTTTAAPKPKGR